MVSLLEPTAILCDNSNRDEILDEDSDDEDDGSIPTILISKEEKRRIRQPWINSIIIKAFSTDRASYNFIFPRIKAQWKPRGKMDCIDLGLDFFLIRFHEKEDLNRVLHGHKEDNYPLKVPQPMAVLNEQNVQTQAPQAPSDGNYNEPLENQRFGPWMSRSYSLSLLTIGGDSSNPKALVSRLIHHSEGCLVTISGDTKMGRLVEANCPQTLYNADGATLPVSFQDDRMHEDNAPGG
ncbi:hypothetical protein SLEP1_g41069 [Rubroshorea leprosula]|uniref:DUF4283 domain-containing protein n=1 Tax=Rubroshorea leprosula TaxID=152421 RepID=A0AAV5L5N5_9ROSI|nr:hypothetical protein SLEP1_g41069 [Rubroshorea leprosula]